MEHVASLSYNGCVSVYSRDGGRSLVVIRRGIDHCNDSASDFVEVRLIKDGLFRRPQSRLVFVGLRQVDHDVFVTETSCPVKEPFKVTPSWNSWAVARRPLAIVPSSNNEDTSEQTGDEDCHPNDRCHNQRYSAVHTTFDQHRISCGDYRAVKNLVEDLVVFLVRWNFDGNAEFVVGRRWEIPRSEGAHLPANEDHGRLLRWRWLLGDLVICQSILAPLRCVLPREGDGRGADSKNDECSD